LQEVSSFPTLRVNGRWVFVDDQGRFEATVPPLAGTNAVIVAATNEQSQPAVQTFTLQGGGPTSGLAPERWVQVAADVSDEDLRQLAQAARERVPQVAGKRYAIVIANADYRDDAVPDLGTPHADARLVGDVLARRYGFEVDLQLDRTRAETFDALRTLGRKLREEDQVAIYYAGHGYSFYGSDLAYWLPVDAETTRANAWISSADVSKLLHRMPARQILLISDSCYSGGFAEAIPRDAISDDLQALLSARAVMSITSGGDEPVEDGAGNSPFAKTLADELESAPVAENMLDMFDRIKERVMAESPQTPNYGAVSFAGYDDGADYVLTRRQ
jgi:NAD(P)-dependent dehydrogenase (short-subunit alcohol dehydrogenase family)